MQGSAKGLVASDERPVAPWARAAFYICLLLLMHTEFSFGRGAKFVPVVWPFHESELALSAALHWCHAPRAMLRLDGALGVIDRLARALLPRAACGAAVRGVGAATSAALLLAAAASVAPHRLGRLAPAVGAAGLLFLEALFESTHGSNHRWLLPSLAAAALAADDPAAPTASARELCVVAAAAIFAAAALAKLSGGYAASWLVSPAAALRWARGDTLEWALRRGVSTPAQRLLLASEPLRRAAAAATLAIELGGAAVLVAPRARARADVAAALCVGWAGFHVGVAAAMPAVRYLPSAIVYLTLCAPWAPPRAAPLRGRLARLHAVARWALLGGFAAAVATRRQLWPFTPVPMFSHARDASWTRECLTADQAAQLAREALPSPTAFDETWYRFDAVLVPPAGASHPARRTLHPRHLAMAGEGHARGSLLVPEAFRPHVLDAAFGRVLGAHAAREGADRAFSAALNVSRVGGGAWADADVAPLAALLPLLEAHADYVAGYHQSDGEVCDASAAAERPSRRRARR